MPIHIPLLGFNSSQYFPLFTYLVNSHIFEYFWKKRFKLYSAICLHLCLYLSPFPTPQIESNYIHFILCGISLVKYNLVLTCWDCSKQEEIPYTMNSWDYKYAYNKFCGNIVHVPSFKIPFLEVIEII